MDGRPRYMVGVAELKAWCYRTRTRWSHMVLEQVTLAVCVWGLGILRLVEDMQEYGLDVGCWIQAPPDKGPLI